MASWYVINAREGEWSEKGPRGRVKDLVDDEAAQFHANLFVLEPGHRMSMYHWEADQEGFFVLSGEALLIVEDEEHALKQWDYFH
ncbi:MAG TPA: cupin domain-containing protein, partial [Gaiellaceae bacterium]|nr:cupin domain-containing protein [Gaiellaceae bacterium]